LRRNKKALLYTGEILMINKQKIVMAALVAFGMFTAISGQQITQAQSNQTPTRSTQNAIITTDRQFVIEAARGGKAEVELGKLALQKAANDDVKQFGQQMVQEHTQANNELKQLAAQKGITLPKDVGAENKEVKAELSKLSGKAFDQAYINQMVKDHAKTVSLFQREAEQGQDEDLKAWATKTLPTLQEHLQRANAIKTQLTATAK
jgi:putative membrane protein